VEFRILGPLEVVGEAGELELGGKKQRALLALLLLRANEVVTRDTAIDALWGDDPPERAAEALQVYVHGLRKALGHDRIALRGTGYALDVESDELDLQRFELLLALGQSALAAGNPAAAAAHFEAAGNLLRMITFHATAGRKIRRAAEYEIESLVVAQHSGFAKISLANFVSFRQSVPLR